MSFLGKLLEEVLHTMEGEPKETYHLENRNSNTGRQRKFQDRSCVLDPMMVMHACSVISDSATDPMDSSPLGSSDQGIF